MKPRSRNEVSIEIYRSGPGGHYRWRMTHLSNGEIVGASTEGYVRRVDCEANLRLVTGWEVDDPA